MNAKSLKDEVDLKEVLKKTGIKIKYFDCDQVPSATKIYSVANLSEKKDRRGIDQLTLFAVVKIVCSSAWFNDRFLMLESEEQYELTASLIREMRMRPRGLGFMKHRTTLYIGKKIITICMSESPKGSNLAKTTLYIGDPDWRIKFSNQIEKDAVEKKKMPRK